MTMLDDDLAAIHSDALALGMANSVTYLTTAAVSSTITGTFSESPEPFLHDEGGEKRRRMATFDCRRSQVALPTKGDRVTSATGAYAGTWTVVDCGTADDGGWLLTIRLDDRIKMGTARSMP